MKTIILVVYILTFLLNDITAQSLKSISAGPKAGINISHWGGDDFDTQSRAGMHIGGFAVLEFSERFALQPELLFSSQGAKVESPDINLPVNYLNLPILAKVMVYEGLYFNIGPQIAFLLSAKEDGMNTQEEYKSTDFGVVIGAGYQLPMGAHVQVRYNAGISNFNNEDFFDEKTSNQVVQISVGYIIWNHSMRN